VPTDEIVDAVIEEDDSIATVAEEAMAKVDVEIVEKEAQKVVDLFRDGFQVGDIFKSLSHLMEVAELFEGATGEEKKEFVVAAFKRGYEKLDPDISGWVPQWLENRLIGYAIDGLLPYAIDWVIDVTKGKLKVNEVKEDDTA
jgi:hypothetical protein